MKKRTRGTGTVSRSKDKFQARLPNRFGRRSIGLFDTEEEAHRRLDVVLVELLGTVSAADLTFAAYGMRWLDEREKTHADAKQDRSRWRSHVVGSDLGEMRLEDIRQVHVRRFYKSLGSKTSTRTGRSLGVSLLRSIKSAVRQCLRAAVDAEIIESSPAEGVHLPKVNLDGRAGDHDDTWTYLKLGEISAIEKLLVAEGRIEALAGFRVGLYAGLRPGEILGLRWEDVDLGRETPRLHVRRSYRGTTKTDKPRHVPLLPLAVQALAEWKKIVPTTRTSIVFPSDSLGVRAKGYVWGWRDKAERYKGKRIVRPGIPTRAGVQRHVTWYSATRHSCASHLLMGTWVKDEKGWMTRRLSLEDVSKWLGHANIAVTQRYAHLSENWLDQHIRR